MARTIPYLTGFLVKPNVINKEGIVTFTDGTTEITPNQQQCEAYGYTYDKATGSCVAFRLTSKIPINNQKTNNNIQGNRNQIQIGALNSYTMGQDNIINRGTKNNILIGQSNEVPRGINNSAVFGGGGVAKMNNSIVLGGNATTDRAGTRQRWTVMYGCDTTDGSTVDSFPNNTEGYFEPQVNRVYYFQSETLAVRTGGSSGSGAVGDFKAWVERGVVKCNAAGTLSIDRSRTSPADNGGALSGWSPINAVSGSNFRQTVKGAANMNIRWATTITFMQVFTNAILP
ncbi:MAG: hypothetical protein Unbinned6316contig1000_2 [Prokaryotic dsDNA virus sp.]|mgnify:CR=1 FL=1|nr:MAG: hypothetical protein Unbinned6316contig1000_2 [Prokaryotic dsDNA virus sp.]|tara:strand:- start:601 stop:1458 length:858 start_codon:yes stop_codon:yes gene_type:complete